MRILMISDVYYPRINGVSTSIQTFRRELQMLGVESTLIAPAYDGQDKLVYDLENEIIRVPAGRVMFDPEDRILKKKYLRDIREMLAAQEFSLIHIQTPFIAHYMGMTLARDLGLPVIETYHTFFEEYFYHYIPFLPKGVLRFAARWFSRTQCNRLDALVVPSTAMHAKLSSYGITTPMAIIPTGINMPAVADVDEKAFLRRHEIPTDKPILLHVGRVAFEKNIGFLIDVYAELKRRLPDVLLVIAGEGPARKSLQKKVEDLGLHKDVHFVGYLDRQRDLPACYRAGDVFVFASRTETQGLVLLEAMAMGLPVVSTAEMGTKDILLPQQGALIAQEEVADFVDKLEMVLANQQRRQDMAREAVRYAQSWSAAAMAEKMQAFYQCLRDQGTETRGATLQADGSLVAEGR